MPVEWEEGDVILDLYEVKEILGEGGFGKVYRIHHKNWNIDLAVKSPLSDKFRADTDKKNFEHECQTWIDLGLHPNIVSCHYVRRLGGIPRVFAEYIEGGSLKDWIDDKKLYEGGERKVIERILDIAIQFAWGLHYAHEHEQGFVHQDVKPANVMMTEDGTAKVTDFGLASARAVSGERESPAQAGHSILVPGAGFMTTEYASPEQAAGKPLSHKTDIWSWAVSILHMFAGEVFWRAGQAAPEALESYLEDGPEDESIPKMPEVLAELLRHCFQRNPGDRPEDMQEIAARLKGIYKDKDTVGREYLREEPRAAELLADTLNNKGVSFLDLGKKEEAEESFRRALEIDPHHPETTYNRGLLLWRFGRMTDDELVRQLEEVVTTYNAEWKAKYFLGLVHIERGDAESAMKMLEDASKQMPGDSNLHVAIAVANKNVRNWFKRTHSFGNHRDSVNAVVFTPDGSSILSAEDSGVLILWDLNNGEKLLEFRGHKKRVLSVTLSGDGSKALSGGADNTMQLWEVQSGRLLFKSDAHRHQVNSVAISSDGLIGASTSERIRVWDLAKGILLREIQINTAVDGHVMITPDDHLILWASPPEQISLWEIDTGRCVSLFGEESKGTFSVAMSGNGHLLLSAHMDRLRLWEISTGRCLKEYKGFPYPAKSVSMTTDGRLAISASIDGTLRLWDVPSGKCMRTFKVHENMIIRGAVAISPDGTQVVSCSTPLPTSKDQSLCVWSVGFGRLGMNQICQPIAYQEITGLRNRVKALSSKAKGLYASGQKRKAYCIIQEAMLVRGYSKDRTLLRLHRQMGRVGRTTGLLDGWQASEFGCIEGSIYAATLSPDGRFALSAEKDNTVKVWEAKSGRCIQTYQGHKRFVNYVEYIPERQCALSNSPSESLMLWDIATGKCLKEFDSYKWPIHRLAVSPDGKFVLLGGTRRSGTIPPIWLLDLSDGKPVRILEGHDRGVTSLAFSPEGHFALAGTSKEVRLWDLWSGECLRAFRQCEPEPVRVDFSSDLRYVVSIGDQIKLWDIITGECVIKCKSPTAPILRASITSDYRFAVLGIGCGMGCALEVWEVKTGQCIKTFGKNKTEIFYTGLSCDGRFALVGSFHEPLRLWELLWDYEFPEPKEWDEGAKPYLEIFLTLHCPCGPDGIVRVGKPRWNDKDFKKLLTELQYHGYGWLRPEGVRKKLEEMTANWRGPLSLPGS